MSKILTPEMCRAARALLGWSQQDLANHAGIALKSVSKFESAVEPLSVKIRERLHSTFQESGLAFWAAHTQNGELDGQAVGFKPKLPYNGFKAM